MLFSRQYENDEKKQGSLKYKYILEKLSKINPIDEEHGIIDIEYITEKCGNVFQKYDVNFCYLFGSYAKSKAKPTSDVDLLISANVKGLKFYGLVEEIREALHKKVDVLEINQLKDNLELTQEELAIKIHVVRQTISKWEKGLSVPDADTLSKLADVLEINVSELLGSEIKEEANKNEVAEQLAKISEQLALKNRRHKRIWKVIGFILLAVIVINMLLVVLGTVTYNEKNADITTIEEKF